jgi:hypothetical protein
MDCGGVMIPAPGVRSDPTGPLKWLPGDEVSITPIASLHQINFLVSIGFVRLSAIMFFVSQGSIDTTPNSIFSLVK